MGLETIQRGRLILRSSEKFFSPETLKYWVGVQRGQSFLPPWGEGASLAFVGHPSSDGIMTKIPYGIDVLLHRPALHPIFAYWVRQN